MTQSYLVQNKSGYCFRIAVPSDLRTTIGLTEIRRSLKVGTLTVARERAWIIAGKIRRLFRWLKDKISNGVGMKLDREKVEQIINQYIEDGIQEIEDEILIKGSVAMLSPESYERAMDKLDTVHSIHVDHMIDVNLGQVHHEADELLTKQGVEIDRDHIDYKRLCHNILKARVGLMDVQIARKNSDYSKSFDFEKFGIPRVQPSEPQYSPPQDISNKSSITLAELIQKHQQENIRANAWSTSTQNDYKTIGKTLVRLMGNVPVHTLTLIEFRQYKEVMQCLPPRFLFTAKYKDMNAKDVVELNLSSDKTISVQSINKNFAYTKSLFSWAENNQYIDVNPTGSLTIRERKTSKEAREAFDTKDLRTLFQSLKSGTNHPYQFWIPLLGLFTGCRREELCQLHVNDLKQTGEGVWYLDINEDPRQKAEKHFQ